MKALEAYCLTVTIFTPDGALDEASQRQFFGRFIDNKIGLYLASGGNGEGHALSAAELRKLYEIGVSECGGKVPVHANLPETHTPQLAIEQAQLAIAAGIEVVHLYTVEERHGMRPNEAEFVAYFDTILKVIRHPVVLCLNPTVGYMPPPAVVARLCDKYRQIIGIRLSNVPDIQLINLKDAIGRSDMRYYAILSTAPAALTVGIDGIFGSKANIIPKTVRHFMNQCETGSFEAIRESYTDLKRFYQHVMKWHPAGARWLKMSMRVLDLPGGRGAIRAPYLMPSDAELDTFTKGLLKLRLPEVDELARAAGLQIAA